MTLLAWRDVLHKFIVVIGFMALIAVEAGKPDSSFSHSLPKISLSTLSSASDQ